MSEEVLKSQTTGGTLVREQNEETPLLKNEARKRSPKKLIDKRATSLPKGRGAMGG